MWPLAQMADRRGCDEILATVRLSGWRSSSLAVYEFGRQLTARFFGSPRASLLALSPISQAEQELFRAAAAESDRFSRLAFEDGNVLRPPA